VKIKAYIIEGILVGLAATVLASRLKSAAPAMGVGYELDAIAGAIIGGVSLQWRHRKSRRYGAGSADDRSNQQRNGPIGVEAFYKQVVKGTIIIIAVLIDRNVPGADRELANKNSREQQLTRVII
jgi:ribose/xylose/arabinose/galactoside ABC-type transport system permease subunit